MKIFYKNNGAISVFLSLILLPVLVFGGMTVDASRIYMSKVVISDAGEMAMNAGLAQYNEKLHDEYGLLVMDQSPEDMEEDLEAFFNGSLNGTGVPDAEDYDKILDLLTKSFDAIDVPGSEIYRTEVEKQQILEYMKYRAPVCIAELLTKKLDQLRDTKKMTEAMEAQMEFSEAMEECQDEFEKAKETLDALDRIVTTFPDTAGIRKELSDTEKDYKEIAAKCLLMREAIQNYDNRSNYKGKDLKEMAEKFIDSAEKVSLSAPDIYQEKNFNSYIDCLDYKKAVEDLGGIHKLSEQGQDLGEEMDSEAGADSEEGLDSEEDSDPENPDASGAGGNPLENAAVSEEDRRELEEITEKYKAEVERLMGNSASYPNALLETAKQVVSVHSETLQSYRNAAETAEQTAKVANRQLREVEKKLKNAADKFSEWDDKTEKLKAVGKAGQMEENVKEYRDFFSNGEGKSNLQQLEELMSKVEEDEKYFGEWKSVLEKEQFFRQSIAEVSSASQLSTYMREAKAAVSGMEVRYASMEQARKNYITHYDHIEASNSRSLRFIGSDPFYRKLQEYCNKENGDSQQQQDEANQHLEQGKAAGEEANKEDADPTYNWNQAGVPLPSAMAGAGGRDADGKLTDLNASSDVNNSSARKDTMKKFKNSISAANSFLEKMEQILKSGIEKLYIAEYAMQMFSYYTVDKENGQTRPDSDIISLSGYSLKEHAAYRAECEYILWGNPESQRNVKNTVMVIFGIQLLFNSFFAFTDSAIDGTAKAAAAAITGAAPYLEPVVEVVIKLGFAGAETASDISKIRQGYGVAVLKNKNTWTLVPHHGSNTKDTGTFTLDYSEYLRIFLCISLLGDNEAAVLGRIADCIQVNTPDMDLLTGYTMLSIQAEVGSRTTFMRRISELGEGRAWGFPDDRYTISYQSILGY